MSAVILWSGGKDSVLTLLAARRTGAAVQYLVTMRGEQSEFRAHPLPLLAMQAASAGIEHVVLTVGEPFHLGYVRALEMLRACGVTEVFTGDLFVRESDEAFAAYWLNTACREAGLRLRCPLADLPRAEVLSLLVGYGVTAYMTAVDTRTLPATLIGNPIDAATADWLVRRAADVPGFDCCGENGEYHSTVVSCPSFDVPAPAFAATVETIGHIAYRPMTVLPMHPSPSNIPLSSKNREGH